MPEHALQHWQDWGIALTQKPALLRELTSGRTNRNYLVEADGQLCVLRINTKNSDDLGIDRQREKDILECASAAGLAPEVLYYSIEYGVLITEFIDGQHWQAGELQDPGKLSLLMEGLQHIHTLDVATTPFNYQQHAGNYWQKIIDANISISNELHRRHENILPLLADIPSSNVICHQDPNPKNIIVQSNRLYFLDWEYAAPAWPAFDFAALSREWDIPADKLSIPDDIKPEEIKQATELYIYLCELWSKLHENKTI